jgi:hypothetical protein
LRERFDEKWMAEPMSGCWLWTGALRQNGYAVISVANRQTLAHRVSWELHRGPIDGGLCVLHHCDNPPCVNPGHLFLGTIADNNADKTAKGRVRTGERPRGEHHKRSKLTVSAVQEMRRRSNDGESQRSLARSFSVSQGNVSLVVNGAAWAHVQSGVPYHD